MKMIKTINEGFEHKFGKVKDSFNSSPRLNEAKSSKSYSLIAFNHDNPEYLTLIKEVPKDKMNAIYDYYEYVQDISNEKGLAIIGNNDEDFEIYSSDYATIEDWDKATYEGLKNDSIENPDEDELYFYDKASGREWYVSRDELEDSKHLVSQWIEDSYLDNDSNAQLFLIDLNNLNKGVLLSGEGDLIIYDNYDDWKEENDDLEESKKIMKKRKSLKEDFGDIISNQQISDIKEDIKTRINYIESQVKKDNLSKWDYYSLLRELQRRLSELEKEYDNLDLKEIKEDIDKKLLKEDTHTAGDITGKLKYLESKLERGEIEEDTYEYILDQINKQIDKIFDYWDF